MRWPWRKPVSKLAEDELLLYAEWYLASSRLATNMPFESWKAFRILMAGSAENTTAWNPRFEA